MAKRSGIVVIGLNELRFVPRVLPYGRMHHAAPGLIQAARVDRPRPGSDFRLPLFTRMAIMRRGVHD